MAHRLLCFFPYEGDRLTGGAQTIASLLPLLARRGYEPLCLLPHDGALGDVLSDRGVATRIVPQPESLDTYNTKILRYSLPEKAGAARDLLAYNLRVARLANEFKADCLWTRSIRGVVMVAFAAHMARLPLVWDVGTEPESVGVVRLLNLVGLSSADRIVLQSPGLRSTLFRSPERKLFDHKFCSVLPGLNRERRQRLEDARRKASDGGGSETDAFEILHVGILHPRKNQLMLLRAVARLMSPPRPVRVRLAGSVEEASWAKCLKTVVEKENLGGIVKFLGWRDDIPKLMARSNLLVLCSKGEGVPQVVREAMFVGLPIVATRVGGVAEVIDDGETGLLVDNNSVDQLCDKLRWCLDNPTRLRRLSDRARSYAINNFSVRVWGERYSQILQTVIDNGKKRA